MSIQITAGSRMVNGVDLIPYIYVGRHERRCWAYICFLQWRIGVSIDAS